MRQLVACHDILSFRLGGGFDKCSEVVQTVLNVRREMETGGARIGVCLEYVSDPVTA